MGGPLIEIGDSERRKVEKGQDAMVWVWVRMVFRYLRITE